MSTANVVNFPTPGESPDHDAQVYNVVITGSGLYNECLCLQYAVTPIPAALIGDRSLHEGGDAGIAIDNHRNVRRECRSAYRLVPMCGRGWGHCHFGRAATNPRWVIVLDHVVERSASCLCRWMRCCAACRM
jgi:hypothetical protein